MAQGYQHLFNQTNGKIIAMDPTKILVQKIQQDNLWERDRILKRGEYLKDRGTVDTNLYFVVSGSLRIFIVDDCEEHTIRFGYENNLLGALDSFISEEPSELYIQALKKTEIKTISKNRFMQFIESSPENSGLWQKILLRLVYHLLERERDILTYSPVDRYQRVLKRSPQLFQHIPHKYIASYLRMTPETLSRIKKS